VVIDTYNYAEYLPQAIESALDQDHPDVEVIVVDDGSTDGTPSVVARYDGRVTALRTPNRGQLAAFGTGFAASRGEMVVFLDADDVLLPHAAGAITDAARSSVVAKVHWPMPEIDAVGKRIGRVRPTQALPSGDLTRQMCELGPEGAAYPPTSGNAWRRNFLTEVLPGPVEEFRLAADQYLGVLAPFHGLVAALDAPQSLYRRHPTSVHSSATLEERARITNEHYSRSVALLRAECERRGMDCAWATWEERSWTRRLERSLHELDALLPAEASVVLMDQDEWALPVGGRWAPVPIPSRDGRYWGLPATGTDLVVELDGRRSDGATHLVVSDSAFWWLDAYPELGEYLCARAADLVSNDRYRLFRFDPVTT